VDGLARAQLALVLQEEVFHIVLDEHIPDSVFVPVAQPSLKSSVLPPLYVINKEHHSTNRYSREGDFDLEDIGQSD
jgi:hypothetical protein